MELSKEYRLKLFIASYLVGLIFGLVFFGMSSLIVVAALCLGEFIDVSHAIGIIILVIIAPAVFVGQMLYNLVKKDESSFLSSLDHKPSIRDDLVNKYISSKLGEKGKSLLR